MRRFGGCTRRPHKILFGVVVTLLLAVAAGNVAGPVLGGALSDAAGSGTLFLGTAAVSALTAAALLPRDVRERAVPA